ncbi:MAG: GH1 family beta-glucosidase [Candidatus Methylacidiphilales bacterium]|nr:GH1 family beta-glucosidase [Candidatus Methylacidiphilales bacterium]
MEIPFNMNMTDGKTGWFPDKFTWGAATSAYQIEGASSADGKGTSVWDVFCSTKGSIWEGQHGSSACDHYLRYREDVDLMRELGLRAYRFSFSWTRVLPDGTGKMNAAGLDFYERLIDALLEKGIEPWATVFHWDYPQALYTRGGWLNPDSPQWFADYASLLIGRFSDRISHWVTLNEPQCFAGLGHRVPATHAPGDRLSLGAALQVGHHVLLAHGRAVQAMRAGACQPLHIGWAPVGCVIIPETHSAENVEAARKAMFATQMASWSEFWNNAWWGDPVVFGRYPEDGLKLFEGHGPRIGNGDMEVISQKLDFYGANIYNAEICRSSAGGGQIKVDYPAGHPQSLFHWKVAEECLYWGPRFLYERYGLPVVITENGISCHDWISLDGKVHDPQRIDFIQRHLRELSRAIGEGVDVRGYFHWSLMDNFEWAEGYKQRFGLVHVDFTSMKRTIKDSGRWYRKVIESNGAAINH